MFLMKTFQKYMIFYFRGYKFFLYPEKSYATEL